MDSLKKERNIIVFCLLLSYGLLVIRTAWTSDDAIITFRSVENFLAGYGLGYNPYVRVQAFTHPLWMFLISFCYYIFQFFVPHSHNGLFNITLALSLLFSISTFYLLLTKFSYNHFSALILVFLMAIFSYPFIDFSTSGLENPLSHFLLLIFIISFINQPTNLLFLSIISGLIALNRMDLLLIVIPAMLYAWFTLERKKIGVIKIILGLSPFFIWTLFSLFYFGFPFPNTAYAKLNHGINDFVLIQQGLDYAVNLFNWSPITVFSICFAGFIAYQHPDRKRLILFLGILLYLAYIIRIGGDFMSGRFFSVPFVISLAIILSASPTITRRSNIYIISVTLLIGVFSPRTPLEINYSQIPIFDKNRITDERLLYKFHESNGFVDNGFLNPSYGSNFAGKKWYFYKYTHVNLVEAGLGRIGYEQGPNVYIIDHYALSDPLLARLPNTRTYWLAGHIYKDLPNGYYETLKYDENKISDPDLALYYSKLDILVTGRLRDWSRIKEIWKFNTGQYDYLIENYQNNLGSQE